jgi:catechol 2,3-dioxygenase-like lactoylglutathione lyase family enzyme
MSEAPPTRGIRHVALLCDDMAKMERFYCDVLGYRVEWRPSPAELYLTRGEDNLALHARPSPASSTREGMSSSGPIASHSDATAPRETRLDHVGFLINRPEEVDLWAAYFQEKGVKIDTQPRTHRDGARSFYLRDPEGNRLQFLYHPPLSDSR